MSEPLEELKQWTRSDADIRNVVTGFLTAFDQARSLDDLHDRFFDDFANLYDACAHLLAQSPLPPERSRGLGQ